MRLRCEAELRSRAAVVQAVRESRVRAQQGAGEIRRYLLLPLAKQLRQLLIFETLFRRSVFS